jgi:energy-coupling factor transporter ATP-binding protein EcfA2
MAKKSATATAAKPRKAISQAGDSPTKTADIVPFVPAPSSEGQTPPAAEPSSPAPSNFNQYVLHHLPLVMATGEGCEGLFAEITEPNGAKLLYRLGSARVAEEVLLLHEKAHQHDPEEVFTDRIRKQAIDYLKAKAHHDAVRRLVAKRHTWVADEGAIYLDLSAADGSCARITAEGWEHMVPATPMFARFPTQRPLPVPVHADDGHLALARMTPAGMTPDAMKLFIGAMLGCLIPSNFARSHSYPVIVVRGDQGSGKSTLCKFIKELLDSETAPIASKPAKADDIFVVGQTAHLLSYDNLVNISPGISDAICMATTGSAVVKRRLYSDSDQTILRAHTPFLLNGICPLLQRPDIIDRSISIALTRIEEFDPEAGSDAAANLPKVLGYLLDLMVRALANYPKMQLDGLPRLASLAKFVHAAEPFGSEFGCDTDFVTLLRRNQADLLTSVDEHHPVIDAIFELMHTTPVWTGTYKELLAALASKTSTEATHSIEWPRHERKLSPFMHARATMLRELGIVFEQGTKRNNGRMLTLTATSAFTYTPVKAR